MTPRRLFLGVLAAVPLLFGRAQPASAADPNCADLPNPLYLQVGDTQEPLMKSLGRALRNSKAKPTTLVYITSGSCTNVEAIYKGVPITMNGKYVPSSAENADWKTSDAALACTIPKDPGHAVEVANSALFVSACNPDDPPKGVKLFQGPNQGYAFVVPEASTETAITAEEAYFTFGFGSAGMVTPWDDENFLFIRPTTKSTLLALAAAIRVPAQKWKGQQRDSSTMVLTDVIASAEPGKTIGILGTEIYDRNRDKVNVLAYRAYRQKYAYYPDSTASKFDKKNVRDGHYTPWSPTVWLTHVDDGGKPTLANAEYVIGLILGNEVTPKPDFEPIDNVVEVGLVPECAMHVTRSVEGGDLSTYEAQEPCDCYYDSKVDTAADSCKKCDDDTKCETGTCRHGYCEAR